MKSIVTLIIAVLVSLSPLCAQGREAEKRILYLNSYHNGYAWSDGILKGIRSVLPMKIQNLNFQVEYLDAKQHDSPDMKASIFDFYREKFRDDRFDVVITSDNFAFEFAVKYREALFAGVPIVFCGLNNFHPAMLKGQKGITGIAESVDFRENLAIARKLHPGARRMVIIGNNGVTARAIIQEIRETIERDGIEFPISFMTGFPIEALKSGDPGALGGLSPDTLVYIVPAYDKSGGIFYSAREISTMFCRAVPLPVYSSWEFLSGTGIVGGKLASGQEHGRTAGEVALKIINGEDPDAIPIRTHGGHAYIFDYTVLEKFKVDRSQLPEGSRIINQPYNFYQLNRTLFWAIMGTMALLSGLVVLLVLNMAQKKKANLAMEASKEQLRLIFDNIPHLVFQQDRNLNLVDVNQSFLEFFNLPDKEAILGRGIASVPDLAYSAGESVRLNREVIETGSPCYARLLKIVRQNQEQLWLEINKIPLVDKKGQLTGVLSTAEDITKKINLKKQLTQAQKMEALGILSGGIAHDFNNILTSIINSTELAMDDVPEDSMTRKDLERVISAGKRGTDLIQQILTFSRPGSVRLKRMDLARVVTDAMALVETFLPGNIEVVTAISPGNHWCQGDPTQIHQVIMNLCTNSFQAMGGMGGRLEVRLAERVLGPGEEEPFSVSEGSYLELTVSDNGPGVDPEVQDKIFDPFFSTKNKNIGTGLGLSMVHGIVQGHGGGIALQSTPYEATCFTVLIPRLEQGQEEESGTRDTGGPGRGKILFVEDDVEQRESIPRVINKMGYEVRAVENAARALEVLGAAPGKFDLVITDYDMPRVSGLDLAKEILGLFPDLPVIMVSGRNVEFSRQESRNIKRFVGKPYDRASLSKAIKDVI